MRPSSICSIKPPDFVIEQFNTRVWLVFMMDFILWFIFNVLNGRLNEGGTATSSTPTSSMGQFIHTHFVHSQFVQSHFVQYPLRPIPTSSTPTSSTPISSNPLCPFPLRPHPFCSIPLCPFPLHQHPFCPIPLCPFSPRPGYTNIKSYFTYVEGLLMFRLKGPIWWSDHDLKLLFRCQQLEMPQIMLWNAAPTNTQTVINWKLKRVLNRYMFNLSLLLLFFFFKFVIFILVQF